MDVGVDVVEPSIFTVIRPVSPWNACGPIDVTLLGITIEVRPGRFMSPAAPMVVSDELGNTIDVISALEEF